MADENDWAFLRAALPDGQDSILRDYVLSKDIYWPLNLPARSPGGGQIPRLSIGSLELSRARLSAAARGASQRAELDEVNQKIDLLRGEWQVNWGRKAAREYSSRLSLWKQYLRELDSDPRANAAFYSNEVRNRAILSLLVADIPDGIPQDQAEQTSLADGILRSLSQPGPFVWDARVEPAFPPAAFWFLYRIIPK